MRWIPYVLGAVAVGSFAAMVLGKPRAEPLPSGPVPVPPNPVPPSGAAAPLATPASSVLTRYDVFQQQARLDITAYQGREAELSQLAADLTAAGFPAQAADVSNALLTVQSLDLPKT